MEGKRRVAAVLLAAGQSRRYGGIKLLDWIEGKPMYLYALELCRALAVTERVVVTGYEQIQERAEDWQMKTVWNDCPELGISHSIKLGLEKVLEARPQVDGVLFMVCDQPYLSAQTVNQMLDSFAGGEKELLCPVPEGGGLEQAGNPCIIGKKYYAELLSLEGDVGGKSVIYRHQEELQLFYLQEEEELRDIDIRL